MAFLGNTVKLVQGTIRHAKTMFCQASIENISANLRVTLNLTNGGVNDSSILVTYTLAGGFYAAFIANFLNRVAGRPIPTINQTITVAGVDAMGDVVGDISVNWSEDSAGTASFAVKPSVNPFATIPLSTSSSPYKIGALVTIDTTVAFGSESSFNHRIFTGRVTNVAFSSSGDVIDISCVDMSYDISRPSNRISNDFYVLPDNIYDEVLSTTIIPPDEENPASLTNDSEGVGNHTLAELVLRFELLGEFHLFDLNDPNNPPFDYGNFVKGSGAVISESIGSDGKYHIRFTVDDLDPVIRPLMKFALPPQEWRVEYGISDEDVAVLETEAPRKSEIIRSIADFAGISDINIQRAGQNEDEQLFGSIIANLEYPLDFIKKIIVPQAWRALYDERGVLQIERETLQDFAHLTIDDSIVLDNSITIDHNTDDVINRQEVSGVVASLPPNTTSSTRPNSTRGRGARHIILGEQEFETGAELLIPIDGPFTSTFTIAGALAQQVIVTFVTDFVTNLLQTSYGQLGGIYTTLVLETSSIADVNAAGESTDPNTNVSYPGEGNVGPQPIPFFGFRSSATLPPVAYRGMFRYIFQAGANSTVYVDPVSGDTFATPQWGYKYDDPSEYTAGTGIKSVTDTGLITQWFPTQSASRTEDATAGTISLAVQVFRPLKAKVDGTVRVGKIKGKVILSGIELYTF
jgi:hypothetical protein